MHVRLARYDVLGRQVALRHDGYLVPATHPFELQESALPGGLYVLRATGDAAPIHRMVMRVR